MAPAARCCRRGSCPSCRRGIAPQDRLSWPWRWLNSRAALVDERLQPRIVRRRDRLAARLHGRHRPTAPASPCSRRRRPAPSAPASRHRLMRCSRLTGPAGCRIERRIARRDALHAGLGVAVAVGAGFVPNRRPWPATAPRRRAPPACRDCWCRRPASPCCRGSCPRRPSGARSSGISAAAKPAARPRSGSEAGEPPAAARARAHSTVIFADGVRGEAVVAGPFERDRAALGRHRVEGDERIGGDGRVERGAENLSPL